MPVSTTSARISVIVPDAGTAELNGLVAAFAAIKASKVNHITIRVPWNTTQHTRLQGGSIGDTGLDIASQLAKDAGLRYGLVLTGPPPGWVGRPDPAAFANFVSLLGNGIKANARAGSRTLPTEITIWDSPNTSASWGTAPDAAEYTALLKAAYPALKASLPGVPVAFGTLTAVIATPTRRATARRGLLNRPSEVSPQVFLTDAYAAGAKGFFDILSYAPLSRETPLMAKPPAPSGDSIKQSDSLRAVMVAKGDSNKKMHWTVGYDTDTGKFSQRQQALYLDTLRWFAEKRRDHVTALTVHTYRDQV
jgi:hypothetical protein